MRSRTKGELDLFVVFVVAAGKKVAEKNSDVDCVAGIPLFV